MFDHNLNHPGYCYSLQLLKQWMTWNDLQGVRKDLKRSTRTWNDQRARNNLKQPSWSNLKRPKTTDSKQISRLQTQAIHSLLYLNFFQYLITIIRGLLQCRIMVKIVRQTFMYFQVYLLRDLWVPYQFNSFLVYSCLTKICS